MNTELASCFHAVTCVGLILFSIAFSTQWPSRVATEALDTQPVPVLTIMKFQSAKH